MLLKLFVYSPFSTIYLYRIEKKTNAFIFYSQKSNSLRNTYMTSYNILTERPNPLIKSFPTYASDSNQTLVFECGTDPSLKNSLLCFDSYF